MRSFSTHLIHDIFLPQVKRRNLISRIKNFIYELPHKLSSNLPQVKRRNLISRLKNFIYELPHKLSSNLPQAKRRNLISRIKNFIYELPHELPNNLRLKILGNKEILAKSQSCMRTQPSVQSPLAEIRFWHWHSKNVQKQISKFFGIA